MQELEDGIRRMSQVAHEQLTDALAAITSGDTTGAEAVIERDDVVDSLNRYLEERCFVIFRESNGVIMERRIRSAQRVIINLERVGDAATHIAKHCLMLAHEGASTLPMALDDLSEIALQGLDEGVASFLDSDLELAKRACEREAELDKVYVQRLEDIASMMDGGSSSGHTLLHLLAVLKYLEKVCDYVLNIGETTVYSHTGSRLTYAQFQQLESLLPGEDKDEAIRGHFWDGISGATVLELGPKGHHMVFKEGYGHKLQDEYERSIEWEKLAPTHTAKVIAFSQNRGRAGLLREYAEGNLFLDTLLSESSHTEVKEALMRQVAEVMADIWKNTITPVPPRIDYVQQMRSRLRDALRRHPRLEKVAREELAGYGALFDLLTKMESRQSWLAPPFSIWIHGDLNANNIVVEGNNVVFIDVHRSQYGDYVQDVATLSTSAVRRFPRGKVAKSVARTNEVLFDVAAEFAHANDDKRYRDRLRLARARSLMTSARLEAEYDRAERLFVEGLDLLKRAARSLKIGRAG
jgi:phosphate uptake regulator/aminoglycoside phosphotransferase (APT) family kinase protein